MLRTVTVTLLDNNDAAQMGDHESMIAMAFQTADALKDPRSEVLISTMFLDHLLCSREERDTNNTAPLTGTDPILIQMGSRGLTAFLRSSVVDPLATLAESFEGVNFKRFTPRANESSVVPMDISIKAKIPMTYSFTPYAKP